MWTVLFGATGRTGRELLLQLLARDHEVTAVVRDPARFDLRYDRLTVCRGDALDPNSFGDTLAGQDAVVSSLGVTGFVNSLRPMTFYESSIAGIVERMRANQVRRLVLVSSVGVTHEPTAPLWYRGLVHPLLRHKYADMKRMEAVAAASGLDWTVVRAGRLTDGPLTQRYRLGEAGTLPHIGALSYPDLASFVAEQATDRSFVGRAVAISY